MSSCHSQLTAQSHTGHAPPTSTASLARPQVQGLGAPIPAACPAISGHCVPAARRAGGIVLGAGVP